MVEVTLICISHCCLTGYYAIGPRLTLVAICPPPQGQSHPFVRDIVSVDLTLKADRIRNICHLINLVGLFELLADLVRPPVAEFVKLAGFFHSSHAAFLWSNS